MKCRLEIVVGSVEWDSPSVNICLGISLTGYPVLYVYPVGGSSSGPVCLGGSGKLCEFNNESPDTSMLCFILSTLSKETMATTDSECLSDLILSLPTNAMDWAKRNYRFVNNKGSCQLYIRFSELRSKKMIYGQISHKEQ